MSVSVNTSLAALSGECGRYGANMTRYLCDIQRVREEEERRRKEVSGYLYEMCVCIIAASRLSKHFLLFSSLCSPPPRCVHALSLAP